MKPVPPRISRVFFCAGTARALPTAKLAARPAAAWSTSRREGAVMRSSVARSTTPTPPRRTMCDNDSLDDMLDYELKSKGLSRRQFGALTLGAGMIAMLPPVANAAETTESSVEIKTPDGTCDAYFVHPAKGASAAV